MADKKWLVQSCCNEGITQIVANNNLLPGGIYKDSIGNCYTVLMATRGTPTIIITSGRLYASCEACGTCASPSPTPTPSITQTPAPTQAVSPSVSVTPSSTIYIFVSKTPSVTPSPSLCVCRYRNVTITAGDIIDAANNTDVSLNGKAFVAYYDCNNNYVSKSYTSSGSYPNDICWNINASVPTTYFFNLNIQYPGKSTTTNTSTCCVPVSPTPTPSSTPVSGSNVVIDDLCMDVSFGPAPSPSATPSKTVSVTPSITVSPSSYPIFPSLTPTPTRSVTPSVTPSKTPSNSVSSTPSVTPSKTPTRTVTPSVTPSKTPSNSVTPSKTPTPTPSQSSGSLVLSDCSVIYNGPNLFLNDEVYAYNSATNVSTLLNLGTSPLTGGSRDVAHTPNKLWLYRTPSNTTTLYEYNITLNPFTSIFNRSINLPVGTSIGAGLCAIDDTTLISSLITVGSSNVKPNQIVQITLDPDDGIASLTYLFPLPSISRMVSGDIMYTTNGKIILTTQTRNAPYSYWISQYALISGVWTLEFDQSITSTAPRPYGLATINNGIYIFSGTNLKQIDNNFPYTVTQVNNINNLIEGASQVVKCNNVTFQPNIIGASTSPSPTPTRTVTPSITVSPSLTPSRTPTPTPSPSAASSNCTGALPLPSGSFIYNGITVTASGTGATTNLCPTALAACAVQSVPNTINLGFPGPLLDYSYTLTFSQPVNNVKLILTAINGIAPNVEFFTFTTDIGIPSVLSTDACFVNIVNNTVTGTRENGGGTFSISTASPYTVLTVTGRGGGPEQNTPMSIDCNSISPVTSSCAPCSIKSLPVGAKGTTTYSNFTVTASYQGPGIPEFSSTAPSTMTCTGLSMPPPSQTIILGFNPGSFICTLTFSQPVNNIKLLIATGGDPVSPSSLETFTFNTSGGTPTLTACGSSCGNIIEDNVLSLGYVLPFGGAILTQINAPNNYTQLIITGNGGLGGSLFALCDDNGIPSSPSPSPSSTPSVTATPSKTPSVTVTPSVTPSKTPSTTPSKTATPSVTISPSRTPSVTPSPSLPSAVCPLIYTSARQTYTGTGQSGGFYNKNYTWNPNTNIQQEIILPNDITGNDIASTGTKLWKSYYDQTLNKFAINEWDLSGNPPYTATFNRTLIYPNNVDGSPGLTAKNNNTLIDTIPTTINGQLIFQVYEFNIPAFPATQLTATFKFNLNSNFRGQGDSMLTSDANGNPDKLLLACVISNPTPGTTNFLTAIQQYDYNTGAFEYETILTTHLFSQYEGIAGIGQFNNIIYAFIVDPFTSGPGSVYTINSNPPYNWTLVSNIGAGGANSIVECSKGKLVGPNISGCNDIFYKTQTSQYYLYNFSTNTSTLLNVPVPSGDSVAVSLGIPVSSLTHTSNKLWSYTWNSNGSNNTRIIIEYNITNNPFTATINRYIALPGGNLDTTGRYHPAPGLLAINNTKLIGIVKAIGSIELKNVYMPVLPGTADPAFLATNGMDVVEYDITTNLAVSTLKGKLFPYEFPANGMLLTTNNKFIIITRTQDNSFYYITQYNYDTWKLEYRAPLTPTISSDCGLAELNGKIYIMGYNIYEFNPVTFGLTLVQSPQTQLADSSQLLNCINTSLPTSSCNDCKALPLKLSGSMVYNGITITPTYTGVLGDPTFFLSPGARDNVYPGEFFSCYGSNVVAHPSYSLWTGNTNPATPLTYSLNFSQPVNNIKILYDGTNGTGGAVGTTSPAPYEIFKWNTNGGTPTITLCNGCGQTINGNVISGSFGPELYPGVPQLPGQPKYTTGGGVITISAPSSYTTLTFTSPGGNAGTLFGICSSSIVPAPAPDICVWSSTDYEMQQISEYNVGTNTLVPITMDNNLFGHTGTCATSEKLWKFDAPNRTIREWFINYYPTSLTFNRDITYLDNYPNWIGSTVIAAIDNNTLITTFCATDQTHPYGVPGSVYVWKFNISTNNAGYGTRLFGIKAGLYASSMMYTTDSKLIVASFNVITGPSTWFLTQYSYPDGLKEVDISLASIPFNPSGEYQGFWVITYLSEIYLIRTYDSSLFKIDTTYPYAITEVTANLGLSQYRQFESSTGECNNVSFTPQFPKCGTTIPNVGKIFTYFGVTGTVTTLSGGIVATSFLNAGYYIGCSGLWQPPFYWVAHGAPATIVLTFDSPINNVGLILSTLDFGDNFTITTNTEVPTITMSNSCYVHVSGNQIITDSIFYGGGSGKFVITTTTPYTVLTIVATNGGAGGPIGLSCDPCCSLPDVTIGTQTWDGCNLDVTNYQNGDEIPQVQNPAEWPNLTTGAWCYYNNDTDNGCTYGKLYNWYAVNDPRGLAPTGYHIPSETEVLTLQSYLGGQLVAGGKMKETGLVHWNSPNTGATNSSGFTALAGGSLVNGQFGGTGISAPFWMTDSSTPTMAYYMDLYNFNSILDIKIFDKVSGHYVRLIKDGSNPLGCVYYSTAGDSTFYYDVVTNTSTPITLPGDNTGNKVEAHTTTKYWKGNQTNYINEWTISDDPTTLTYSREISISGLPAPFSTFLWLQAVDDTTLLTTVPTVSSGNNPAGDFIISLVRLNITNNTVTAAQMTTMFNIYAPSGIDAILLTNTNKLITIGRRATSLYQYVYYLSQYSYPNGTLELDINISSTIPAGSNIYDIKLFESNGNLYVAVSSTYPTEIIYNVNLNSPYTFTPVWTTTNPNQWFASYNSSINCNTVNLNVSTTIKTLTLSKVTCDDGLLADNFHNNSVCGLLNESPAMDWILSGFTTTDVVDYEILCEDTSASNFIHWDVTGINKNQTSIAQNGTWTSNTGLTISPTDFPSGDRVNGWNGPCPPSGVHNYRMQVKANLTNGTTVTSNYSYFTATQARNFNTIYKYLDIQ